MENDRILTIQGVLRRQAGLAPEAPALLAPGEPALTYAQLLARAEALAAALAGHGIGSGDRVAIVLPNGPGAALAFLGVTMTASAAPLNPAYRAAEFEHYLSGLRAKAVVAAADATACREAARGLNVPVFELAELRGGKAGSFAPAAPRDEALVLFTSGTTARPKLVPLTQANLCHSSYNVAETLALTPRDRCLNVMPLFHIHGLVAAVLASLAAGASFVATAGFEAARFFSWLDEFQPTWYTAVPTIHQAVLSAARAAGLSAVNSPLRFVRSSSSALPPAVMSELETLFGVPAVEAYGMTEAAHQMASNPLPPRIRKPGSAGPAAGPEVAIMDEAGNLLEPDREGEVVIRGPNVTAGYENNPAANSQAFTNGWFRTGDLGRLDDDGYLFLTGRLKELINRGGEKIAPKEIDNCLLEHPGVAQAVAFAVPHTSLGQDVAAAVVPRDGVELEPGELRHYAAGRLAAFKVPGRILIVKEIPKGPTGKLQRIGLAEQLGLFERGGTAAKTEPYVAPRTLLEQTLAALWADVLRAERVGVNDSFSQLGGDSLLAAALLARAGSEFQIGPDALVFDEVPTVAEMAQRIEELRAAE